ncbi:MAG: molybdenum cofactor biosynthesis protein MoaE [Acidiferrobacterales bacterium]
MTVIVSDEAFQPWQVLADYEQQRDGLQGQVGAAAVFVGTMRTLSQGCTVEAMTLEHYPGMTEKYLQLICREAGEKWQILDSFVQHRYGRILPDESIVLVAVWSERRESAFKACRYIIDELKSRAPFWKQEQTDKGMHWVESNT